MKNFLLLAMFLGLEILFGKISLAQNTFPSSGSVGVGTTTPNASSILEVKSTTQGALIPRMTKAQRDAIASPAQGLLVYVTDKKPGIYFYEGGWTGLKGANLSLSNLTSPTAIDVDLLPATDNAVSFGSLTLRWKDVNLYNLKFSDGSTQTTAFTPYTSGAGINIVSGVITNTGDVNASDDANLSLSNLSSTSINAALLPGTDNTLDLGSSTKSWRDIYFDGSIYLDGVKFISNGSESVFVGADAGHSNAGGYYNSAIGYQALYSNTTGNYNTASGHQALFSNTTGIYNTADGDGALHSNTTGLGNTAVGEEAMYYNTTGGNNSAIGVTALRVNTTGSYNVACGGATLGWNTTGSFNTANGFGALSDNTTGNYNTADGHYTLVHNTTGISNTATGEAALYNNTTGNTNTAMGVGALASNVSGYSNVAVGKSSLFYNTESNIVAVGDSALYHNGNDAVTSIDATANAGVGSKALFGNTTGRANSAMGFESLYSNTTGIHNAACGYQAIYSNTTGTENTSIGYKAGFSLTTGSSNTFIGASTDCGSLGTLTNATAIGNGASVSTSNKFVFGNGSVTGWGFGLEPGSRAIKVGTSSSNGNGAYLTTGGVWTDISDQRKKENITELDKNSVLEKILQLKISQWKYRGTENEYHIGPMAADFHRLFEVGDDSSISSMDKTGVLFLAVQALSEEDGRQKTEDVRQNEKLETLTTENKELKMKNEELNAEVGNQKSEMEQLKTNLATFEEQVNSQLSIRNSQLNDGAAKISFSNEDASPLLGQNLPNPFDNSTIIPFRIPKGCHSAAIVVSESSTGKLITAIPVTCDETHAVIDAGTLASGNYSYTLYVDGKVIDTKQMVLTK